jgi:protease-4
MEEWLDRVYEDFTTKVGEGRKLSKEAVEKVAKGRIWTGEDAKELGLVDELGGFPAALKLARTAMKLPEGEPVRLKVYPEKKTLLKFISDIRQIAADDNLESSLARTLEQVQPFVRIVDPLGLSTRSDVLRMPEFE